MFNPKGRSNISSKWYRSNFLNSSQTHSNYRSKEKLPRNSKCDHFYWPQVRLEKWVNRRHQILAVVQVPVGWQHWAHDLRLERGDLLAIVRFNSEVVLLPRLAPRPRPLRGRVYEVETYRPRLEGDRWGTRIRRGSHPRCRCRTFCTITTTKTGIRKR